MSFISTDCLHDPSEQPVPVVVNDIPGSFPLSPPQVLRYCGRRLYHHTTPSLEICNNKTETRFLAQIKPANHDSPDFREECEILVMVSEG